MKNLNKRLSKNICLDYVYATINNLNMSNSIWVLYLAYRGMSLMEIGILEGVYHVTSMLFEIPSGALADLVGKRKSMLIGRVCSAISCILMLVSGNFGLFALSFIFQALGNNFNSGSEEALVYDSIKLLHREDDYLKINGRINFLIEISQALATVIGGILAEYSYTWCYGACIFIAVLSLFPVLLMTEPPVQGTEQASQNKNHLFRQLTLHFKTSFKLLQSDTRIWHIVVYYSAVFAIHALLFFYSQKYFYDLGFNKIQISFVMLFAGGAACIGSISSSWFFEHFHVKIVKICAILIALCIACFGFKNVIIATAATLLIDFCNAMLYPIQSLSLNKLIPSEQRATLISVSSMFFSIVMILFFPIAGALADIFGLANIFSCIGIGFAIIFIALRNIKL